MIVMLRRPSASAAIFPPTQTPERLSAVAPALPRLMMAGPVGRHPHSSESALTRCSAGMEAALAT